MKEFFESLKNNTIPSDFSLTPIVREFSEPPVNKQEVFRYAGVPVSAIKQKTDILDDNAIADLIKLSNGQLSYRVSYILTPIARDEEGFPILPIKQHSADLKKNLEGCRGAVIFACTIGAGIDRLIRKYERTEPSRGLMFQGFGAERVESLADTFNWMVDEEAKEAGLSTNPRFSPGFGDLPITVQPELLKLVDAERRLGITLNASFLMAPSKSVTAIIGIK